MTMTYYKEIISIVTLLMVDIHGDINKEVSDTQCKCVPSNFCADDDAANTGAGLLDIRLETGECLNYFETCCKNIIQPPLTNQALDNTIFKGCGYSNVIPIAVSSRNILQKRNSQFEGLPEFIARITDHSTTAEYGELPWSTIILLKDADYAQRNLYRCGGSLIHPQVVLTAGHCVFGIDPTYLTVRVGEWDTRTQEEPFPYQDVQVEDIIIHPKFSSTSLTNDIALLFLKSKVELSANVGIICLTPLDPKMALMTCIGSGWGKNAFKHGKHSTILKKVDLPLVGREKCITSLRQTRLGPSYTLDQSFLCAGGEKGKDTCKGDGGSPLVCPIPGTKDRHFQIGIVSWGIGCGDNIPGVYVNAPLYINWIELQLVTRSLDTSFYKY